MLMVFLATAQQLKIPAALLLAICSAETGLQNVDNMADGGSPSYGMCQVKLATAKDMLQPTTADLLKEPMWNIRIAGLYLQYQLKRYDNNKYDAISAYNAGTSLKNKKGKYGNQKYIKRVLRGCKRR